MPEALMQPDFPELAAEVWGYFLDFHQSRGGGGMGPSPISVQDFYAWQIDNGVRLEPWERRAIKACDLAYLEAVNDSLKREADGD